MLTPFRTRIIIAALLLLGTHGVLNSNPTVIKDNRLNNLGVTPALGRGYSIATNTFQSICLKQPKTTKASFDFDFTFMELKEDSEETARHEGTFAGQETFDWIKHVTGSKTLDRDGKMHHNHHILAKLVVNSYYSSVDEGSTALSEDARVLLKNKDMLGFFQSCGPYYIRSLGRRSTFLTIFTYSTPAEGRNKSFEGTLNRELKKFGTAKKDGSDKFKKQAEDLYLRISSKSIGLAGDPGKSLIATDLITFRKVLNTAYKATQSEFTGRVSTMEVVPWVENIAFQRMLSFSPKTVGDELVDTYDQKLIVNENAEFYMQVVRVKRARMNIYYKARLCKQYLDVRFLTRPNFQIKARFQGKKLINQDNGDKMRLGELVLYLSRERIFNLYKVNRKYTKKVRRCFRKLIPNFNLKNYQEINDCRDLEPQLAYAPDETIDGYCMPTISSGP